MKTFVQLLIEGIEQGSLYALWALSYSIVYQILGLLNFAFGDVLIFAVYLIIAMVGFGVPLWLCLLAGLCAAPIAFMLIERYIYSGFVRHGQGAMGFIAAISCAYIFRNLGTIMLGNEPVALPTLFGTTTFNVGGIVIATNGLITLGVTAILLAMFVAYFRFTRVGRSIGLVGQDRLTAAVVGIHVRRVVTMVYGVSGALGLVGTLLFANLLGSVNSTTGFYITFQAFIAATVGGVGSLTGSVLGGLALGLVESLAAGYVSGDFAQALAWVAMAAVVLVRPRGLMGRVEVERV